MSITYDKILNHLNKKYTVISKNKKNYFINNERKVVASYDNHSISMYFEISKDSDEIHNHNGIAIATFAKDFQVNDRIADIIILEGLVGACNDAKIVGNYAYLLNNNCELRELFETNSRQKQFDSLPYEERIKLLNELTGASFDGAKIDGIQLFSPESEPKLSSCGQIYASNGVASIKLSDEIVIENIKINEQIDGFDLNIINIKGNNPNVNYTQVYNFWRHENDWMYNLGFSTAGSYETREWTERRKNSIVDEDSIFIIGNPYKHILDSIYYDSKSSLNARRLQMKHVLSQLVANPNDMLKDYDFNKREIDVQSKSR